MSDTDPKQTLIDAGVAPDRIMDFEANVERAVEHAIETTSADLSAREAASVPPVVRHELLAKLADDGPDRFETAADLFDNWDGIGAQMVTGFVLTRVAARDDAPPAVTTLAEEVE